MAGVAREVRGCLARGEGERVACVMDEDEEGRRFPVLLPPSEAVGLALLPGPGRVMGVIA